MSTPISGPSWTQVRTIYEQVCDLPMAQRSNALAEACGEDHTLRSAVEQLLAHDSRDGDSFLGEPLARLTPLGAFESFELEAGTQIAGFRLLRRLGQGGMGAVYEAEQQHPQRRVALKVLRPELATNEALRRFDIEVESLARMQHPDIARLYDAGIHEIDAQGLHLRLPWYAMELIEDARDLIGHARTGSLDRPARIALLARVADAVHHAHLRGIVHRDLKPANVLVDAEGAPKIIDFGIARAIDARSHGEGTRTGALLGTPRYMAPEQKNGSAEVDARCDVWALGAMLQELLEHASSDPSGKTAEKRAALPHELAWILGEAQNANPAERYGSAQAFAEDLRRFLRGEAVLAAPPSLLYEWTKLLRRHRLSFLAAAAVLVALGVGLFVALQALQREQSTSALLEHALQREQGTNMLLERARSDAEDRRLAAERANARSQRELTLRAATLTQLQRTISAAKGRAGDGLTVKQLVDQLARDVESPDSSLSAIARATMCNYLGDLAFANGELDQAEAQMQRALEWLDELEMDEALWRERVLGLCGLAEIHRTQGRFARCAEVIEEARGIVSEQRLDDRMYSSVLRRGVLLALSEGHGADALRLAEENLELRRRCYGEGEPETVEALLDRAKAACEVGITDAALALLEESLIAAERVWGPRDSRVLIGKNNLGACWLRRGEWQRGAALCDEVSRVHAELFGDAHPTTMRMRANVANAWIQLGKHAAAASELERLLALTELHREARHTSAAEILDLRRLAASARRESGELDRAWELVQDIPAFEEGEDDPTLVKRTECRIEGARTLVRREAFADARALLEASQEVIGSRLGEEHSMYLKLGRELAAIESRD